MEETKFNKASSFSTSTADFHMHMMLSNTLVNTHTHGYTHCTNIFLKRESKKIN